MTRPRTARLLGALSAGLLLAGMAPGDMTIKRFLERAEPLTRLGPFALASPEAERLKAEVVAAGRRYEARIAAQRRAGQRTDSCPPETGSLTPEQWLAHLNSYPRRLHAAISVSAAFDGLMRKRYPCPD